MKLSIYESDPDSIDIIVTGYPAPRSFAVPIEIRRLISDSLVTLNSTGGSMLCVIGDKERALNLIKGLEKAIELGWFDV